MFVSLVGGWAIDHIVWASWWYPSMASTTIFSRYIDLIGGDLVRVEDLLDCV